MSISSVSSSWFVFFHILYYKDISGGLRYGRRQNNGDANMFTRQWKEWGGRKTGLFYSGGDRISTVQTHPLL
ncbi:MAG TPA: hypothetical protein VFV31_14955 [Chitinophagaceae bacterium]|nr:hypothetical protein [Chitinophagaceae bacterium]